METTVNRLTASLERILDFLDRDVPPVSRAFEVKVVICAGLTFIVLWMVLQFLFRLLTDTWFRYLFYWAFWWWVAAEPHPAMDPYWNWDAAYYEQFENIESSLNTQWRIVVISLIVGLIIAFLFSCFLIDIYIKLNTLKERPTSSSRTSNPDENLCTICLDQRQNCVLLPCRHLYTCQTCAKEVVTTGDGLCPLCRSKIAELMTVFH